MRVLTWLVLTLPWPLLAADVSVPLANAGFEDGRADWSIEDKMSSITTEQAAGGTHSLKVVDTSTTDGSNVHATPVAVTGGHTYQLRGKVYPVSGSGLGIYVRRLDAQRKLIGRGDECHRGAPTGPVGKWVPFDLLVDTTDDTRFVELWIHSYSAAIVTAYLDDFALVDLSASPPPQPLWPPQYKLKPGDGARLTAADVVGPDGLVYPDWTMAGVPGGIPQVPVKVRAADHGAKPDDGQDDADGLEAAVAAAAKAGGGAVQLDAGTYHLDRCVAIRHNGIVLRGAGREKTRIIFRYAMGAGGTRWAEPRGDVLYRNSTVTFQAAPTGLKRLQIFAGDKQVADRPWQPHWGNTFSATTGVDAIFKAAGPTAQTVTLRGVGTYADGSTKEQTRTLKLQRDGDDPADVRRAPADVAISFCGDARRWKSPQLKLAKDGLRGDTHLTLTEARGLKAGDWIGLEGPATERWKTLTRNACRWGTYRRNLLQITAVDGPLVRLAQPLRIEFPVVDGSYVYKVDLIEGCGIEDLTIEQTENLWITTVMFSGARGCWARGVTVKKCGRNAIYGAEAKQCTIADCVFEDAWFKGGGGTAYAGWEHSFDCLMTDCTTWRLRHAPCVQWAASGNVLRRSVFHDSDMQWHSGWTNENLMEQCTVVARTGNGAYGYGAWASPPEDDAHGPNGPRNVVYNCDLNSPKAGLWMGGMNEGWMILYNRFVAAAGPGIYAKTFSFDHTILGNVFALKDSGQPAVMLATPDCTGVEIRGNRLYGGNGRVTGGPAKVLAQDNQVLAYQADPPRPTPAVPSIYEWQLAHPVQRGRR